jgi:MoxR-like ATPase
VTDVHVAQPVKEYILDLVGATRESPDVAHGASPRASLAFLNTGKAQAAIEGREYVIPDDVKALAEPILAHRLVLSTDAELSDVGPRQVVRDVVDSVAPPSAEGMLEDSADGEEAVGDGGTTPEEG